MNIIKPSVVLSEDMRTATIVGVNGNRVTVVAQSALAVWSRQDGGVTLRADQSCQSQTVRVDRYGRIFNGKRPRP